MMCDVRCWACLSLGGKVAGAANGSGEVFSLDFGYHHTKDKEGLEDCCRPAWIRGDGQSLKPLCQA